MEKKQVVIDESTDMSKVDLADIKVVEGVSTIPDVPKVCMAILMKHSDSPYIGWEEIIGLAPVEMVDALTKKMYRKGYLQKDFGTNTLKIASLGIHTLRMAAEEVGVK